MFKISLECSTAHISQCDSEMLTGEAPKAPVLAEYEYGYFLFIPEEQDWEDEMSEVGYSTEIIELIKYAKKKGASILRLDRDAEIIEGLRTFSW